jgi:hypothetical protein
MLCDESGVVLNLNHDSGVTVRAEANEGYY